MINFFQGHNFVNRITMNLIDALKIPANKLNEEQVDKRECPSNVEIFEFLIK